MGSLNLIAQDDLTGTWEGQILIAGQALDMLVHFTEGSEGLSATIDIPAQGARGLPLQNVSHQGQKVHFELMGSPGLAVFEGTQQANGSLAGSFTQASYEGTFELSRKRDVPPSPAALAKHRPLLGTWRGSISVSGQVLPFAVEFKVEGEDLEAFMDIQGGEGLPLQNVSHTPPTVHFELAAGLGLVIMEGDLKNPTTIAGSFRQGGGVGTFEMKIEARTRVEPEPDKPEPYDEEEVEFHNGDVKLAGTLSLPQGPGPHPALILITGSGPQNRDEEVAGFKIFATIADHLTRNGIAVLRYDDRGMGGSTGVLTSSTLSDFSDDVLAATALLKNHGRINHTQIGLLGHSEGGIVAPLAANASGEIAFTILMAGTGVPGSKLLYEQKSLILRAQGASDERLKVGEQVQTAIIEALRSNQWDDARAIIRKELEMSMSDLPQEALSAITDRKAFVDGQIENAITSINTPWFRSFVDHDPGPVLEQLTIPVLALFGGLDLQVPGALNEPPMVDAFEKSGHSDFTIKTFSDANHLFQKANTGTPQEYATLEKSFTPGFLDFITSWIQERVQVLD